MLVKRNLHDQPLPPLAMEGIQGVSMRILVGRSDGAPNFALRQFNVAAGGHTPHHSHNYEHEVVVTGGAGTVTYGEERFPLTEGDVLLVQPNVMHQFQADRGSDLTFLCLVPVSFDCGKTTPGS